LLGNPNSGLKKAFDYVHQNIFLEKLFQNGVRGIPLKFLASYLNNKVQFTRIANTKSLLNLTRDVPQGSIAGPLLFLIYIIDIVKASIFNIFYMLRKSISTFQEKNTKSKKLTMSSKN